MTNALTATLRRAPATVPALVAMALFVLWATEQAGYPVTHWGPGALIVLALLGLTLAIVPLRISQVSVPVKIALGCLAGYTALSYLSIIWAGVPGDAWEGANRTLLYLLVFALFACWRQRGASAALLLGAWTLAMIVLAAFVALHVNAAGGAHLQSMFSGERLAYPTGYPNASAAQWLIVFWPALLLARSGRVPWPVRGTLAGGAVLLAEVALLSQSRGSLYATPVMLVLVFALLPDRTRTFATLVPVALGIAAAAPAVLRVGDHLKNGNVVPATLHSAITATFAAARGGRAGGGAGRGDREPASVLGGFRQPGTQGHQRRRDRDARRRGGGRIGRRGQPGHEGQARLGHLQGRLFRQLGWQPADERAREQPLRLLPGGPRRIRRTSAPWNRCRQLPAAVPRTRPQ